VESSDIFKVTIKSCIHSLEGFDYQYHKFYWNVFIAESKLISSKVFFHHKHIISPVIHVAQ
jgi:hypothetical protein